MLMSYKQWGAMWAYLVHLIVYFNRPLEALALCSLSSFLIPGASQVLCLSASPPALERSASLN